MRCVRSSEIVNLFSIARRGKGLRGGGLGADAAFRLFGVLTGAWTAFCTGAPQKGFVPVCLALTCLSSLSAYSREFFGGLSEVFEAQVLDEIESVAALGCASPQRLELAQVRQLELSPLGSAIKSPT